MMTFLLQFFLNHQCIDQHKIYNWYINRDVLGVLAYKGFHQAKHLATPFIKSLPTKQTVVNQPVQMEIKENVTNQTVQMEIKENVINQTIKMEIKEEVIVID